MAYHPVFTIVSSGATLEDNIVFASYAFGFHAYAGGVGLLNGLTIPRREAKSNITQSQVKF